MTYNLHPIFVHFPIALLFLYSVLAIIPLELWFPKISWKQIRLFLLVIGLLGAFAALWTGSTARHLTNPSRQVVGMHSTFAALSTWLYGFLLCLEIVPFFAFSFVQRRRFVYSLLIKTIALVALISILITGLLGGVMVYGTSADPISPTVLHILNISP